MSKGIDQLKYWAMHNVRLISILPSNKNLTVDTKLFDLLESEVDENLFEDETYKDIEMVKGNSVKKCNFYAKDNIVVTEEVLYEKTFEYDYEYIEPDFRQIGERYLLVNQDGTQAEVLIKLNDGVYETVRVIHDPDEIIRLELITAKDGMGRMGEQAIETFISNSCEPGDTINAYNRTVDKTGISPTLTTRPEGFKTAILPITEDMRIRKLTPLECWRLQGFTDQQFYKAKNDGVSNAQLYKQAGNSVTVNIIDEIVKNLT